MDEMRRVVVTVYRHGDSRGCDLEVSGALPVRELARDVAVALRWVQSDADPSGFTVVVEPGGATLPGDQSLAALNLWDGSILVISTPSTSVNDTTQEGPVLITASGRRLPLVAPRYSIGRRPLNGEGISDGVPLLDLRDEPGGLTVSRLHADLTAHNGFWVLRPCRTINATSVNGELLSEGATHTLCDGERLAFGDVEVTYLAGADA
jgi:hypothetical protein